MPRRNATPTRAPSALQQQRRRIAVEAARLISEHGLRDYGQAKRKAAAMLGIDDEQALPRNDAIDAALREHQRLFEPVSQPQRLRELREVAREAMRFFAAFEPRLVGAVLDGTADRHSAVCLHLFSDEAEALPRLLQERGIPYDEIERLVRVRRDESARFPAYRFADETAQIDLTVLPRDALRQAPFERHGDRPIERASLGDVEQLIRHDDAAGTGDP